MSGTVEFSDLMPHVVERFDEQIEIQGLGRANVNGGIVVLDRDGATGASVAKRGGAAKRPAGGRRMLVFFEVEAAGAEPELDERLVNVLAKTLRATLVASLAHSAQIRDLAESFSPAVEPPLPAVLLQARRNAKARQELLEELGAFTATGIAEARGSTASNTSALAGRWRKEGKIFAVGYRDRTLFPAFQFDAEIWPLPVIARVLELFERARMSDWEIALWFATPTGALDDRRPADLLRDDPDAVVAAAEAELAGASG